MVLLCYGKIYIAFFQVNEVGTVSAEILAPPEPGTYQSHWRLVHAGMRFGHRIWCSIVVDPAEILEVPAQQEVITEQKVCAGFFNERRIDRECISSAVFQSFVFLSFDHEAIKSDVAISAEIFMFISFAWSWHRIRLVKDRAGVKPNR